LFVYTIRASKKKRYKNKLCVQIKKNRSKFLMKNLFYRESFIFFKDVNYCYLHFLNYINVKVNYNLLKILKAILIKLHHNIVIERAINFNIKKNLSLEDFFVYGKEGKKKKHFLLKNHAAYIKSLKGFEPYFFGYKFNFSGRFSRKQRSSNFWFIQGSVPSTNIEMNVDYGLFSVNLDNSRCTVKVWLYKSKFAPLYKTKF